MPRAKVRPEDRQRSAVACLPCKRAKIRCDSGTPCTTCSKRGRETSCIYQESPGRNAIRRHRRLSSTTTNIDSSVGHETSTKHHDGGSREGSDDAGASMTTDEAGEPQSRTLLSSKLQKVYTGETASLSYLQFLRQVLKYRLGPCAFTEGGFNNFMLENDIGSRDYEAFDVLEPDERQALGQIYLDATSGLFKFHTKVEVSNSLNSSNPSIGLATTSLILAIGAQCRGSSSSDLQHASSYFTHGQQLSFQGMLCDPTIDMVRNFLLMAFYMLGACHRNAAFMYLGVASKAASALGLHRSDQYRDLPVDEFSLRLNTWKSLRVLDTIVNSILGRCSGLPGNLQPDEHLSELCKHSKVDGGARDIALKAIFDICPFMDELERKSCKQDTASAENFLQRLQKWSKSLPEELRTSTDASLVTSTSVDRESSIGRTHVACVYYFAVILTTRRFLTLYLLDRLQERTSSEHQSRKHKIENKTSSLAQICLDAAVNLAKVGNNLMNSDQMLKNMCLLKAWMFAAGLLLGFSSFAQQSDSSTETETAFCQTRTVLRKLAELSLQAGHYYEILTTLSDAGTLFQRKVADERKQKTSQYLDEVFTSNTPKAVGEDISPTNFNIDPDIATDSNGILDFAADLTTNGMSLDSMTTGPYGLMISEGFPWPADDLSFDWQMYGDFSNDVF